MSASKILALISLSAVVLTSNAGNWNVPTEAKKLLNPTTATKQSLAKGAKIFTARCVSCHGEHGLGDGTEMRVNYSLQSVLATITQPEGGLLSDGELYWKITHGVGKMPSYAGILTDEERWLMVNHLRTLPVPESEKY